MWKSIQSIGIKIMNITIIGSQNTCLFIEMTWFRNIHGQAKKIIWGSNSQGTTQKICRPPSAAENFSASHAAPGYKMTKIFLPIGYSWYTPRVVSLVLSCRDWLPRDHFWDFSWFFLNFPGFFQFFTNFYPKICRPPSAAKNFFRPWVVHPYLNFFTHGTKTT